MADELGEVVRVERAVVQPLDGSDQGDLFGDRFPIRADDVDLRVVGACPVAAEEGQPESQIRVGDHVPGFSGCLGRQRNYRLDQAFRGQQLQRPAQRARWDPA
ncbi:hypothetical protein, partial [Protofrankia symbiont of Coriaria ruscifolia]|uniref:hypothetical protein n=1 Tax=Protofrankia symbiont of Coriaria ruscifolia TaxID=1306542 RepID=UPI001A94709C